MKTYGALLVLLCCCWAEEPHLGGDTSTQDTCQPDIYTVLREMRAVIAGQRAELKYTKTLMEAMDTRLRASETTIQEQKVVIEELKEKQQEQVAAVKRERVAFSTSLLASGSGNTGPVTSATPLVYRHIFTNIGNHYNPNTGVFTAPVRGIYHFVVYVHATGIPSKAGGVSLHKNGQHVVLAHQHQPDHSINTSNGVSLLLEVGDVVHVKLWPDSWVYDNHNHMTTFSGHLIFPMAD